MGRIGGFRQTDCVPNGISKKKKKKLIRDN